MSLFNDRTTLVKHFGKNIQNFSESFSSSVSFKTHLVNLFKP